MLITRLKSQPALVKIWKAKEVNGPHWKLVGFVSKTEIYVFVTQTFRCDLNSTQPAGWMFVKVIAYCA